MSEDRRDNRDHEIGRPLVELISAYLDDRESLSIQELAHVERLLEQDRDAQRIFAELRVITDGLAELDPVPAPRSYHLDAEMVGAQEPVVLQETSAWYVRHTEKVRWATAAAAILFVFVLGADLVLNGVFFDDAGGDSSSDASQPEMTSRQAETFDGDPAAPGDGDAAGADEAAGDDAGGGEDATAEEVPETFGDSDTSEEEIPPDAESEDQAASGTDDAAATENGDTSGDELPPGEIDETEEDAPVPGESGQTEQTLAFDQDAAEDSGDEDSNRRLWRIAEFSVAVLLGLLITALVVLPRLDGNAASRTRGDQ